MVFHGGIVEAARRVVGAGLPAMGVSIAQNRRQARSHRIALSQQARKPRVIDVAARERDRVALPRELRAVVHERGER